MGRFVVVALSVALLMLGTVAPVAAAAELSIDSSEAALGNVQVGQPGNLFIDILNSGDEPATIIDLSASGDSADALSTEIDCAGRTLQPGVSCQHHWDYTFAIAGPIDIEIEITSDDPVSPYYVAITGTVIDGPAIVVTPSAHDFGGVGIGDQSTPQTFVIDNIGFVPVDISAIGFAVGSADFESVPISEDCTSNRPLPAGNQCSATVTFTPQTLGSKSATLVLTTDMDPSAVLIELQGTGEPQAPAVTLDPPSYDFGIVDQSGTGHNFTISNAGTGTLIVSSIEYPTQQEFQSGGWDECTGVAVPSGSSCQVHVRFEPSFEGFRQGNLIVTSNATSSPDLVLLSGTADFPDVTSFSVSPSNYDYGAVPLDGQHGNKVFTVTNTGDVTVNLVSVHTDDIDNQFQIFTDECTGVAVAPSDSCDVLLFFAPASPGLQEGTLVVTSDTSLIAEATVHGTGVEPVSAFTVSPSGSFDFGTIQILQPGIFGAQAFTVTNTGNTNLHGWDNFVSGGGADFPGLNIDSCSGHTIVPSATCTVSVLFQPQSVGPKSATLTVSNPAGQEQVALSGTGSLNPPTISVTPSSHDFGPVRVGLNSTQSFIVTNTGPSNFTIFLTGFSGPQGQFQVFNDTCDDVTLAPSATCSLSVLFGGSDVGPSAATLRVVTAAGTAFVSLTGSIFTSGINGTITSGGGPVGDLIVVACGDPGCLQTTSAADGAYELSPLGAGDYLVSLIKPPNYGIQHVSPAITVGTGLTDYDIDLPTGGMSGLVRDTGGQIVSANIIVCGTSGNCSSTISDASGYQLPYLPADSYTVTLQPMDADHVETLPPDPILVGSALLVQDLVIDLLTPPSPDEASGDPGPGGTVGTGGGEPSPADPTTTAVTTPQGGSVTIAEAAGGTPPTGYGLVGQAVTITAPPATPDDPLRITFRVDASAIPGGHNASTLEVFRNGDLVQECDVPGSGDAIPTPCIDERTTLGDGDIEITAVTVAASVWNLAVVSPYSFTGFFAPVDNAPTVNKANSGQAIPVKFSLGGNRGLDIFAVDAPYSQRTTCDSGAPMDAIETVITAGGSSLSYHAGSDRYQFVWKTQKAWAGTCRTLYLHFADGTTQVAHFNFKK